MSQETVVSLKELQKVDDEIRQVRERIEDVEERLAEAEVPLLEAEETAKATRDRLSQMKLDERKLESSADEKRARIKKLDERMTKVQNLREEVAVRAELDIVRRAMEADEQEALGLLDQIRRTEVSLDELEASVAEARAELGPQREELESERAREQAQLGKLEDRREEWVEQIGDGERKVYESFRASGRRVVIAHLLEDGACGNCFGMIPLQVQNEIRGGGEMIRCEACGVIVAAPETSPES